jgi:competence protein ComEC
VKYVSVFLLILMVSSCIPNKTVVNTPVDSAQLHPSTGMRTDEVFATQPYKGLLTIRYLYLPNKEHSGDSIVIQAPDGKTMLIDSGIAAVGPQIVHYLDQLGIGTIDIALNTHPHSDHIGGFASVMRAKKVNLFYLPNFPAAPWLSYADTMNQVRIKQIKLANLEAGDHFQLSQDVQLEVLNPHKGELPDAIKTFELEEVNDRSIVLKMTYKANSFLFTGDIHRDREMELISEYGEKLRADFMDAPHHGFSTSSSPGFLKAVSPKVAVFSENLSINFPQLLKYQQNNIATYATGLHGNILITSDGKKLNVITEKDYPPKK